MHRVVGLLVVEVVALDLAIPAQIFGREPDLYEWTVCAAGGPCPIPTETGFDVLVPRDLDALASADTIIVPGIGDRAWPLPEAPLEALRTAAAAGARVASICTGAFVLAAAGLLAGRRATTHWRWTDQLARAYPDVDVDPGVLYIDDGDVLTSAGVTAGIDLCLHIVRRDHGAHAANAIARRIVFAGHRDGGQAQYVDRALPPSPGGGLAATRDWMREQLSRPLTVEAMARHAGYSPRTFARRFVEETGTSPLRWLIRERVREAQRLLEATSLGIDGVASESGLGSAAALRKHFGRTLGTSPSAYRRAFAER